MSLHEVLGNRYIYKTILIQIGIRFLFFETIMEMGIQ